MFDYDWAYPVLLCVNVGGLNAVHKRQVSVSWGHHRCVARSRDIWHRCRKTKWLAEIDECYSSNYPDKDTSPLICNKAKYFKAFKRHPYKLIITTPYYSIIGCI